MRKVYLITAIVLLSSLWAVAQNTPPPTVPDSQQQNPSSAAPSQQQKPVPPPPDTSQTATAPAPSDQGKSVEGCLGGASGSYTLTDSAGKTWQLSGDTSGLGDHVGHTVAAWGKEDPQGAFNVKKVKMIASACPSK
jgi:hypothetical protein